METLTDARLLFTFQTKVLQFLRNFGNGVSSCCSRQSIKWRCISFTSKTASIGDFPSNISTAYEPQKDRSCSHLFAYTLAEKWVWLSRVHQLHYYIILKHTSFIHDSNLALSCRLIINLGTIVNCHRAIGEYGCDLLGGKIYLLFFAYSKQIGSFFHRQALYILAFALHPLYGSLAKRLGNAKYQHLPSLNCRCHCESKTPSHCWYW